MAHAGWPGRGAGPDAVTVVLIAAAVLCSVLLLLAYAPQQPEDELVAQDVTLAEHQMEKKTSGESKNLLEDAARLTELPASDYVANTEEEFIIPARWGLRLNTSLLHTRLLEAASGARLHPVWDIIPPENPTPQPGQFPVRGAQPGSNAVGLMINVAWGGEHLHTMLDVLQQHQAQATFFVLGKWAEENAELISNILAQGHRIAAHGYADRHPARMTREELRTDLKKAVYVLREHSGYPPLLYTPHYGEVSEYTLQEAHNQGLTTLLWTADTADWLLQDPEAMMNRIKPDVKDGAMILMHPTENTPAFLSEFLSYLEDKGLRAVSCERLLQPLPQPPDNLGEVLEQLDDNRASNRRR